ncbi:MAG: hypothetical protein ACLQBA_05775 [Candidatus Binataceae bacterium]
MAAIPDRPSDLALTATAATSTPRLAILLGVEVCWSPRCNSYAYLPPGIALPHDLDNALKQFADAPIAIKLIDPSYGYPLTLIPRVVAAVNQRQPIFKNAFFAVYRRAPG